MIERKMTITLINIAYRSRDLNRILLEYEVTVTTVL